MGMIEGIGDEVIHFFIGISVLLIVAIAWATTNIRQQWNLRTVYLLDRRRIRRNRVQMLSNHMESATISHGRETVEASMVNVLPNSDAEVQVNDVLEGTVPGEAVDPTVLEQTEILEVMDAHDTDSLRRRRLAFYEREGILVEEVNQSESSSDEEIQEAISTENTQTLNPTPSEPSESITIKLKFINDDLKAVEASLEQSLGDFRRRNFVTELSTNKRVRLIFNGQVLQRDNDSLRQCGMFNNCVVHCLVHQQAAQPSAGDGTAAQNTPGFRNNNNNNNNVRDPEWDLGNILIISVAIGLASAWYFRYHYPQLFTITATVGLIAITGLFSVISYSVFFPDLQVGHLTVR